MPPMTHSGAAKVTLPTDEEILITREFGAQRHLVYKAYTTPELIRRWWAGKRGNVTVAEVDLRVGGRYRYALVTDDGTEVAFNGEFREIVAGERLVNTEIYEGAPPSDDDPVLNVVTFTELDGDRTLLEILVQCPNKAVRDIIIDSGMEGGMQEGMDALEQVAISLR
jgi:uncharacterized protein YndB with AHSA1/START domain